jgi:putative FmdB family regulatory protein
MPIYAYKCEACGYAKDVLQRMSDPLLTECPECKAQAFSKQVTAAGFQLKGAGWYVTDFRGGEKGEKSAEGANSGIAAAPKTETAAASTGATPVAAAAPVTAAPAASPAPAAKPAASPTASPSV